MQLGFLVSAVCLYVATIVFSPLQARESDDFMRIGGALKFNYKYMVDSPDSKGTAGDFYYDVGSLSFDSKQGKFGLSADYRFKTDHQYIKYAYGYYQPSDTLHFQLGLNTVPFGNQNLISNSYWFGLPYYLGFEDDKDMGLKSIIKHDGATTEFAYYVSSEYSPTNKNRYAADLYVGEVDGKQYFNEEANQLNLRHTESFNHSRGSFALGVSYQYGQIIHQKNQTKGDRSAWAVHLESKVDDWTLQLQMMEYQFNAPDSQDKNRIAMSLAGSSYEVASKAKVYNANLARKVKTSWGELKLYNDFGLMTPNVNDPKFANSVQNVTGVTTRVGPIEVMLDYIVGHNLVFLSKANNHVGLPLEANNWDKRLNCNMAYYF
ncbi:hypothetical protein G3R49_10210 [Shewanella sp. WXL01]|uniref:hypothetical protein n=1 Tax=Shewanella sp. WXL01 TaxID=2709721 RepID=UPI00143838A5|nr:hypothetical protein [Shewanella sp. WXL01]NKF50934.1 hypothetical protein [Shewanella sp. WXL01]